MKGEHGNTRKLLARHWECWFHVQSPGDRVAPPGWDLPSQEGADGALGQESGIRSDGRAVERKSAPARQRHGVRATVAIPSGTGPALEV